jgi:hypothetical protein
MVWAHTSFRPDKMTDDEIVELIRSMPATCVLDLADHAPVELHEIADMFGVSRQRIDQMVHGQSNVKRGALAKVKRALARLRIHGAEDLAPDPRIGSAAEEADDYDPGMTLGECEKDATINIWSGDRWTTTVSSGGAYVH